ncbi:MAG: hypothetical protein KTR19_02675 [Hyphomicrobiales bacterium]|nr:hypothetical protein [Hyphomicrobiales bacterium]
MFEWIEKLFASLIVLVMLFILLLVAFPDRLSEIFGTSRPSVAEKPNSDQDLTGPTALPKGDVKPQKTVGRLPDSSDNQKALYRYIYRDKPYASEPVPVRKIYVETRRVVHHEPKLYVERSRPEPRYSRAREDCGFGSCLCNCRKPYWAAADWDDEDVECW